MRATPISTSRRHTHRPGPTPTAAFAFVWLAALGAPPTPAVAQLAGTCFDVVEMGLWYPVESTLAREDLRGPPPAEDSYNKAFPVRIRIEDDTMATGEWSRRRPSARGPRRSEPPGGTAPLVSGCCRGAPCHGRG